MPEKEHGTLFTAVWIVVEKKSWELVLQKRVLEEINGVENMSAVLLRETEQFFQPEIHFFPDRMPTRLNEPWPIAVFYLNKQSPRFMSVQNTPNPTAQQC